MSYVIDDVLQFQHAPDTDYYTLTPSSVFHPSWLAIPPTLASVYLTSWRIGGSERLLAPVNAKLFASAALLSELRLPDDLEWRARSKLAGFLRTAALKPIADFGLTTCHLGQSMSLQLTSYIEPIFVIGKRHVIGSPKEEQE